MMVRYYFYVIYIEGVAWLGLGHSHLMKDTPFDYQKALEAYQSALRTLATIEIADLWYGIGYLYMKFNSWNQADAAFQSAFKIAEGALTAAVEDSAHPLASQTVLLSRLSEIAYRRLFILNVQGQPPDAMFLDLIERSPPQGLAPADTLAIVSHGRLQLKDFEGAARAARAALMDNPSHSPSILRLSCALMEMGRHSDCRELLGTLLHDNDRDLVAHYLLARSHLAKGEFHEAHQEFQSAIMRPSACTAEFWVSIACLYFQLDQTREAFEALMFALKLKPTSPRVWSNLGVLYERCGQNIEAEVAYRKALEHDGGKCETAHSRLAILSPLIREAEKAANEENVDIKVGSGSSKPNEEANGDDKVIPPKLENSNDASSNNKLPQAEADTLGSGAVPTEAELWEVISNLYVITVANFSEWAAGEDGSVDVYIPGWVDFRMVANDDIEDGNDYEEEENKLNMNIVNSRVNNQQIKSIKNISNSTTVSTSIKNSLDSVQQLQPHVGSTSSPSVIIQDGQISNKEQNLSNNNGTVKMDQPAVKTEEKRNQEQEGSENKGGNDMNSSEDVEMNA